MLPGTEMGGVSRTLTRAGAGGLGHTPGRVQEETAPRLRMAKVREPQAPPSHHSTHQRLHSHALNRTVYKQMHKNVKTCLQKHTHTVS